MRCRDRWSRRHPRLIYSRLSTPSRCSAPGKTAGTERENCAHSILRLERGDYEWTDTEGEHFRGAERLTAIHTIRAGRLWGRPFRYPDRRSWHAASAVSGYNRAISEVKRPDVSSRGDWWNDQEQRLLFETRMRSVRMPRRQLLKFVSAAAIAVAFATAGSDSSAVTASSPPGTTTSAGDAVAARASDASPEQILRSYALYEPASFDFNKDIYCGGQADCFAGLAALDPDYHVVPDMAESWGVSPNGAVYTFHLRDSYWSNGDPVTADDFEWSFKRQLNPATGAAYPEFLFDIKNAQAYNHGMLTDESQVGVKALDPKTLEITLEGPRSYFPVLMGYYASFPANRKAVEEFSDTWTEAANIVCNGPYTLTSWDHFQQYTIERNSGYWNASVLSLTKITQSILSNEEALAAYLNDSIDWYNGGTVDTLGYTQLNPKISGQIFRFSAFGTWYLVPSATIAPFDNVNVRLAVAHAIDRDAVVNGPYQGLGRAAYTYNPPGTPGYNPDTYDAYTRFDPAMAMELLKGTPYEGGTNWPKITLTQRAETHLDAAAGDAIIQMLQDNLGMTIDHVIGDSKAIYDEMYQGKVQLMWVRWYIDYPDPNDFEYLVFYGKTQSGHRQTWHNDEYDDIVTSAAAVTDPVERAARYREADAILAQQAAAVFVVHPYRYGLLKPYVQGLPFNQMGEPVPNFSIFNRMYEYLSIAPPEAAADSQRRVD